MGALGGALHPELRSRLQRIGIAIPGLGRATGGSGTADITRVEACVVAAARNAAAGGSRNADEEEQQLLPSSRDAGLDDLLLQLSDLDARSRALQAQSEVMSREMVAKKEDGSGTSEEAQASHGGAAQSVARQHPLRGLPLGAVAAAVCAGDFQRHGARHRRSERPPVAPASAMPSTPARCSGYRCTLLASSPLDVGSDCLHLPPSPSSARGSRSKCAVALPPLKPSTSAPGRLNGDPPWTKRRW